MCREYDSQERSASEVKQEIERHLKDKETLENSLPSSIVIGPYWISTEGVRQALAKKRKALANAVIDLLAKKLRKQADMVCDVAFCFIQKCFDFGWLNFFHKPLFGGLRFRGCRLKIFKSQQNFLKVATTGEKIFVIKRTNIIDVSLLRTTSSALYLCYKGKTGG